MAKKVYTPAEVSACIVVDQNVKKAQDRLVLLSVQKAAADGTFTAANELELQLMKSNLTKFEAEFVNLNCRNKIEYQRLLDAAQTTTEYAIKQEAEILSKNNFEQNIYIMVGATVLVTGLIILLSKNNDAK